MSALAAAVNSWTVKPVGSEGYRTAEVTLELDATKSAQSPWVTLAELESARLDGAERLVELIQERSGSSASRVRNDLARPVDDSLADRVLTACHGNTALRDRIKPFSHLVRTDPWGYPLVYPAGAFIVTTGSDRRETGTHYTPKSLTEAIVAETLTLPSEAYLLERMQPADPAPLRAALIHLSRELGQAMQADFLARYLDLEVEGEYRYHPADAGKRAFEAHLGQRFALEQPGQTG